VQAGVLLYQRAGSRGGDLGGGGQEEDGGDGDTMVLTIEEDVKRLRKHTRKRSCVDIDVERKEVFASNTLGVCVEQPRGSHTSR
jgi:hypothetical protein